jgi:hypothetical protein|tara:strand:+ start:1743 stop:2375 length:633 start_codon:yes stop_codon:yes gene_type:complete
MKSTEMLNQIKTLLNIEVKLEEMKLENGTLISAESFEKDKEIFIVTDDERVAMPVGEYILEDGRLLVVSEEGMIGDVREVSDEVPSKESEEGEEITSDLADEEEEKEMEEDKEEDKDSEMAEVGDWEGMEKRIQNLEDAIADLKKDKVEASEEEANILKSRTVKEEFSEAASKPIKHNPEGESKTKKKVEFAKGKFNSTAMDRVLNKLKK